MTRLALTLTLVAGCSFTPGGTLSGDDDDVLTVSGFAADAVDVSDGPAPVRGLLNAPCAPTGDDCAAGFTCRLRTADTGLCRPIADGAPGDGCDVDDDCGANMTCIEPDHVCAIVCDSAAPAARCGALLCLPVWGAVGVCELPG